MAIQGGSMKRKVNNSSSGSSGNGSVPGLQGRGVQCVHQSVCGKRTGKYVYVGTDR